VHEGSMRRARAVNKARDHFVTSGTSLVPERFVLCGRGSFEETEMTMLRAIASVFVFGLMAAFGFAPVQAQNVSLQAELLKDWSSLKTTMPALAAEMPADKYTFRPTDGQQTFGERVLHVAMVNVGILGALDGGGGAKPTIDSKATAKDAAIKAMD